MSSKSVLDMSALLVAKGYVYPEQRDALALLLTQYIPQETVENTKNTPIIGDKSTVEDNSKVSDHKPSKENNMENMTPEQMKDIVDGIKVLPELKKSLDAITASVSSFDARVKKMEEVIEEMTEKDPTWKSILKWGAIGAFSLASAIVLVETGAAVFGVNGILVKRTPEALAGQFQLASKWANENKVNLISAYAE